MIFINPHLINMQWAPSYVASVVEFYSQLKQAEAEKEIYEFLALRCDDKRDYCDI